MFARGFFASRVSRMGEVSGRVTDRPVEIHLGFEEREVGVEPVDPEEPRVGPHDPVDLACEAVPLALEEAEISGGLEGERHSFE